jgi:thioredoxin-related protein
MLSKVIEDAKDKINVPIVEFDIDSEMMTAINYGVRGVPAMILVDDNEKEIRRLNGYVNEEKLLEFLNA